MRLPQKPGALYDAYVGFVGTTVVSHRHLRGWLVAAAMVSLGCGQVTDPSAPCEATELGEAEPGTMVSRQYAPVLAVTAAPQPFVLQYVCNGEGTEGCTLKRRNLEGLGPGNQVMITSSGRFVVAIDRDRPSLMWYRLTPEHGITDTDSFLITENDPVRLVTSLRNSDWLVVRDAAQRLLRYLPGRSGGEALAPGIDGLTLVAVGERHVVARQVVGNDSEVLWLVPVDESLPYVDHGPIRMGEFDALEQVVVAPGDARVLVTNGEGQDAYTSVFSVPDGWVDRFSGSLADGRRRHETLPGMHAISPDGSHVAYRTASGAVALRDLELGSSCLVRSSSAGDHRLAAFSAQGMLYMESSSGPGETSVTAWNPASRRLWSLAGRDDGYRLAQVPARQLDPSDPPWVVGVRNGSHAALQQDADPQPLELDTTLFLPRDATEIWTLDGTDIANATRHVNVRQIKPSLDVTTRSFDFTKAMPGPEDELGFDLSPQDLVCMSTGTPGAWDYRCGKGNSSTFFSGKTTPPSETDKPSTDDAEVPVPGKGQPCGTKGVPVAEAGNSCAFFVQDDRCCYDDELYACLSLNCGDTPCIETTHDGQTEVACATQSGP